MSATARKIIHIDLDAFYASVEQRDDPALQGRPVAVGGSARGGVVMAASYEARRYGVRSAMPGREATARCPDLVFVPPRFDVYRAASDQMRAVMDQYTGLVEPHGLDEAYLDVTEPRQGPPSATLLARRMRGDIRCVTGLTASAGVAPSKFVAKAASAICKPDGLLVVPPAAVEAFVAQLPVRRFWGVGPVTEARMHEAGYASGLDLRRAGEAALSQRFGRFGRFLYLLACGVDPRTVQPTRKRKSVGRQRTFVPYLSGRAACEAALEQIAGEVARRMAHHRLAARRVTLRVRDERFVTVTRQTTPAAPLWTADSLSALVARLLHAHLALVARPVRLLGVSVSGLLAREAMGGLQLALPLDETYRSGLQESD